MIGYKCLSYPKLKLAAWQSVNNGYNRQMDPDDITKEHCGLEKEDEVIALLMFLGEPPSLVEHYYTENRKKCLSLKTNAEESSNAYYECAKVNAILTGKKIVRVIKKLEVLKWFMMIIIFLQKY